MPDIILLPTLADYFNVSVDELLGLKPLSGEEYIKEPSGTKEFWEQKLEYLLRTRKTYWNMDYMQFLIKNVWRIEKPVNILDCGCGYGSLGLMMLPLLPAKSSYTGVDFAEDLTQFGKKMFSNADLQVEFINKDVYEYETEKKYDMVISQAVLRHLDDAESFVNKMLSFAKQDALVVCIDANREFECDGIYIDGMDYFDLCEHQGLLKKWKMEYEQQGRDYAVAIRTSHIMRKLGLKSVEVRMNDKISFVTPEQDHYEQVLDDFIQYNDWNYRLDKDELDKRIQSFMNHGMDRKEAEEYCDKSNRIGEYLLEHKGNISFTHFKGQMISYGRKE
jgi:SAM-dependent methyltransferase